MILQSFLFQFPLLQFAKQSLAHPTSHPALHHGPWGILMEEQLSAPVQPIPAKSSFPQPTISSQRVPHPARLAVAPLKKRRSNSAHKPAPAQTRARFPARDWLHAPGHGNSSRGTQGAAKHRFRSCSISPSKWSRPLRHN